MTYLDEEEGYNPARIAVDAEADFLVDRPVFAKHPLNKGMRADIAERNTIMATDDIPALEAWVEARISNPLFLTQAKLVDEHTANHKLASHVFKLVEAHYNDPQAIYERKNNVLDENKIETYYDPYALTVEFNAQGYARVREEGYKVQREYNAREMAKHIINLYKNVTAIGVNHLGELYNSQTPLTEYTGAKLRNLVKTGSFPSGSREWLEARQSGIGGSDVGKIVGAKTDRTYNASNKASVFASKLDEISQEQVDAQTVAQATFKDASSRGNAWEEYILHRFARRHPELNVVACKTSWVNKNDAKQKANFDGLLADDDGNLTGIIEIKTSSRPQDWGEVELGLDGIPEHYRSQVLWYADAAGLTHGVLIAVLHDHEVREYFFTIGDKERNLIAYEKDAVDEFYSNIQDIKSGVKVDPRLLDPTPRPLFGPTFLKGVYKGDFQAFTELALWLEISESDACKLVIGNIELRGMNLTESLLSAYGSKTAEQRTRNIVSIDLETSGMSPNTGNIIEVGISIVNPAGEEIDKLARLYGMPVASMNATGTGAVEVHGISEGMIAKKRQFSNIIEQERVLAMLKQGVVYAHNASFEKRWLKQHLAGFAEALASGEIVFIDTMSLTRRLLPTARYKLQSMVTYFGIDYLNAHRAYADAEMTARGVRALQNNFNKVLTDQVVHQVYRNEVLAGNVKNPMNRDAVYASEKELV